MRNPRPTRRFLPVCLLAFCTALALPAALLRAQGPGAAVALNLGVDTLPVLIGEATAKTPAADGQLSYYVFATAPVDAKTTGQKVQLLIRETGGTNATGRRTATSFVLINTGKYKTVAQLRALLAEVFRRFASADPKVVGQVAGKVGDVRYGGELRMVVETPDLLRFEYDPPTTNPVRFSRNDAAVFAGILR